MTITYEQARERCERHGQGHVLAFWNQLDPAGRAGLLAQIETLDFDSIARMRALLQGHGTTAPASAFEPAEVLSFSDAERAQFAALGGQALARGEVGAILVAGGQGSRLGYDGPKGAFSIGPVSHASLFEIHARKILALERRYGCDVPFYIMTSQANDRATRDFFEQAHYFGLCRERVFFFVQGMWPALWADGRLILEAPDRLFMSPDGHGGTLSALRDRGMLDDMRRRGLKTLYYFQVDNPLVEIADPAFIGAHTKRGAQFSVKVCAKRDPDEGLGVVVRRDGRCAVIEYTELTKEQKTAVLPDGRLKFCYGSVAIHVFDLDFLVKQADAALPLHVAHKKITFVNEAGRIEKPSAPNGFKFEKFIFDALPEADTALNVEFAREDEFSPVKNAEGADSPATARRDIVRKFGRWMEACGVAVPRDPAGEPLHAIEIDPCFALDAAELKDRLPAGFKIEKETLLRNV